MIKLLFLVIFFLATPHSLRADDVPGGDQEFKGELDNTKNPFEDGVPKPVAVIEPVYVKPKPAVPHPLKVKPVAKPKVTLPKLDLQGVIVGEDIHQAIINDQVVPLSGTIEGARVDAVTKEGVELFYKDKKFFLKID